MKNITRSLCLSLLVTGALLAQNAPAPHGTVDRIQVHGKSLEGNLEGDSPDRSVSVYLPPSYGKHATRRYPVIYMLHGYTDSDAKWFGAVKHWINLPALLDEAYAADSSLTEAIVVMPDGYTRYQGSMYSNSVTTGDWESYIARELPAYIDAHYRTMPSAESRGLAGHSMGGYGAMRIGMRHPDVFASVYLLSPCCLSPQTGTPVVTNPSIRAKVEAVKTLEDFDRADFMTRIVFASAAAWAPNPAGPPMYIDSPLDPLAQAKFAANMPLAMMDQYVPELRKLRGLAFDAGTKDEPILTGLRILDRSLTQYRISHSFEVYEGDHVNRIAERIRTKMLPFFTKKLAVAGPAL